MTGQGQQLGGGYERSDARIRPLFLFGVGLAVLVAAALLASHWISARMTAAARRGEQENPMRAALAAPAGPALQALPAAELAELRAREERTLAATEWIDPLNGIVRIPIERALELVLVEGFPTRGAPREERK